MAKNKWYMGHKPGSPGRVVFQSVNTPTKATCPQYDSVIGPFRTKRGAIWAASTMAVNNPHFQTVADAERIAKGV